VQDNGYEMIFFSPSPLKKKILPRIATVTERDAIDTGTQDGSERVKERGTLLTDMYGPVSLGQYPLSSP